MSFQQGQDEELEPAASEPSRLRVYSVVQSPIRGGPFRTAPMRVEDRDFFGQVTIRDVPVPVPTPGTILIRTAYSWRGPSEPHALSAGRVSGVAPVLRAAIKRPWRTLQHGARYVILGETRGLRLALDHYLHAHDQYVKQAHTCFSVSGRIEECAEGTSDDDWRRGTFVAGLGLKSAPYAPFHVVSRQFLLKVPMEPALPLASLLVPAAMVLHGLDRAISRSNPATIIVIGWNAISRLTACYGLESAANIAVAGSHQELSQASPLGVPRYRDQSTATDAQSLCANLNGPTLFVFGTPATNDIPEAVLETVALHADAHALWILSAPRPPSTDVLRLLGRSSTSSPCPIPGPRRIWTSSAKHLWTCRHGRRPHTCAVLSTGCAAPPTACSRNAFRREPSTGRLPMTLTAS